MNASDTERPASGFHPVNIAHLVMGLVLLGGVAVWALVEGGVVAHEDLRWLLPVPWVVGGGVGLLAAAVTGTRRHGIQQSGWVGLSAAGPTSGASSDPTSEPEPQSEPEPDPEPDEAETPSEVQP